MPHNRSKGREAPKDLAARMSRGADGYVRQTFTLNRLDARKQAEAMFKRFPKAAYGTVIENWRELPGDRIEFTMRRLPSAD